jgi:DNA invertase Pin-like site-specific DNA recombinase
MIRGVIYARYSSDAQREESIDAQIRENTAFAQRSGIEIVGTYIDRALSAKTDNRPEFQQMIRDSAKKKFDVVIVWRLDRFSRNRYDSAKYKAILKKNNVRVISATENISENPEGILLESMLEGYAEYFSAELAVKVTRGMVENALKAKYNGGTVPLGYIIDENQDFQIDPVTAPAVLEMFQMFASGSTMQEVVDTMNAMGIRSGRGNLITVNGVTRMLHNRKYIGEYRFQDVVIPNGVPAIVPQDLFDRVQERMSSNHKAPAKHKAEDEYLLTTKLFCGCCQRMMVGESGTSRTGQTHRYYKCIGVKKHLGCGKKSVKKDWIEDLVLMYIRKILFDDELIEKLADRMMEELGKENTVLPLLRRNLADTEKGIENMLNAIQMGIFTPSTKQRLEELEQRRKDLTLQIAKEELAPPTLTRDQILFWLYRFRELNPQKLEHRRRLINSFVNAVYLYDDYFVFVGNYKDGTKTITFAELEAAGIGSDLNALSVPRIRGPPLGGPLILYIGWDSNN